MRHTFGSLLINIGEPVTYASRQLGHKDSAITLKVYARWLPELYELGTGGFLGVTFGLVNIHDKQYGTLYQVKPDGTFVAFHRFSWLDGANPFVGLTQASDGALYGTQAAWAVEA